VYEADNEAWPECYLLVDAAAGVETCGFLCAVFALFGDAEVKEQSGGETGEVGGCVGEDGGGCGEDCCCGSDVGFPDARDNGFGLVLGRGFVLDGDQAVDTVVLNRVSIVATWKLVSQG
jgi:hypothetical protein